MVVSLEQDDGDIVFLKIKPLFDSFFQTFLESSFDGVSFCQALQLFCRCTMHLVDGSVQHDAVCQISFVWKAPGTPVPQAPRELKGDLFILTPSIHKLLPLGLRQRNSLLQLCGDNGPGTAQFVFILDPDNGFFCLCCLYPWFSGPRLYYRLLPILIASISVALSKLESLVKYRTD